ncbi:hypothetical protein Bra1253DRAFT_06683 [Bradyrhizobium sp. WSM1253]|jgi:AraC-like DNA-binding protein|nr:hypothetical protein Bra1253DRAFT_06683 [Bradyrhizobium sp. WSM1253]
MVSPSPSALHSTSSSTIVAMADITIRSLGRSGTRERPYCAALGYACDHIFEALTLEHLAEAAGMSRRQFGRPRIPGADRRHTRAHG